MEAREPSKLLSRLRFVQLRLLCGVAEGQTFRQLAAQMALSQPAITKMAQELETALGDTVFFRERRGVRLTPFGEQLIHDARLIVNQLSRMDERISQHHLGVHSTIKVGSPSYTAVSLLSEPVSRLIRQQPNMRIKMVDGVADALFEELRTGKIDFLVGSLPTSASDDEYCPALQVETLYPDEICFLAHKSKQSLFTQPVGWEKLQTFSWVMPPKDSLIQRTLRSTMLNNGLPIPPASVEASVVPAIGALVSENRDFIGVLRADAAYYLAKRLDLTIVRTKQRIALPPVAIVRLAHSEPQPAVVELFTLIRQRVTSLFAGGRHIYTQLP